MTLSRDEAAAAVVKLRDTWPDDHARALLELPAREAAFVLAFVHLLDARPEPGTAASSEVAKPEVRFMPPRRATSRPPIPGEAVALMRRWNLPLPSSYQLALGDDDVDVDGEAA